MPRATNATAVTESSSPTEHPKAEATSPMTAVSIPIHIMATMKQSQPPNRSNHTQAMTVFLVVRLFTVTAMTLAGHVIKHVRNNNNYALHLQFVKKSSY